MEQTVEERQGFSSSPAPWHLPSIVTLTILPLSHCACSKGPCRAQTSERWSCPPCVPRLPDAAGQRHSNAHIDASAARWLFQLPPHSLGSACRCLSWVGFLPHLSMASRPHYSSPDLTTAAPCDSLISAPGDNLAPRIFVQTSLDTE